MFTRDGKPAIDFLLRTENLREDVQVCLAAALLWGLLTVIAATSLPPFHCTRHPLPPCAVQLPHHTHLSTHHCARPSCGISMSGGRRVCRLWLVTFALTMPTLIRFVELLVSPRYFPFVIHLFCFCMMAALMTSMLSWRLGRPPRRLLSDLAQSRSVLSVMPRTTWAPLPAPLPTSAATTNLIWTRLVMSWPEERGN